MKTLNEFCCGQPIEGMKGRPDGCIVDVTDSGSGVLHSKEHYIQKRFFV